MEEFIKKEDIAGQAFYKTLCHDTGYGVKLELVTNIMYTNEECDTAVLTRFEVSNENGLQLRFKDLDGAVYAFNKEISKRKTIDHEI